MVYGQLPPETRSAQARLFNNPSSGLDVLVASDAVGMGLNLNIKRVVFHSLLKFNDDGGAEAIDPGHNQPTSPSTSEPTHPQAS